MWFYNILRVALHCKFLCCGTDSRLQLASCGQRMQSNANSGVCQIQCGVRCYQNQKLSNFWTNTDWTRFFLIQLNFSVQGRPSRREYFFAFPSVQMMLEQGLEALWILESCFDFSLWALSAGSSSWWPGCQGWAEAGGVWLCLYKTWDVIIILFLSCWYLEWHLRKLTITHASSQSGSHSHTPEIEEQEAGNIS